MKCDKLESYYYYEDRVFTPATHTYRVYHADEVDAAIAELKDVIHEQQVDLEGAKATAYADSVDAGMRERRLRRAFYKACANWADVEVFERTVGIDDPNVEANRWALMRNRCLKKAEEYR